MDTLGSLSSHLPNRPPVEQELADLDANIIAEFKTAACAVTKLYKLSGSKAKVLKSQGYIECLQDVIQFITSADDSRPSLNSIRSNTSSVSIEDVLNWALNKQHHLSQGSFSSSPSSSSGASSSTNPEFSATSSSENRSSTNTSSSVKDVKLPGSTIPTHMSSPALNQSTITQKATTSYNHANITSIESSNSNNSVSSDPHPKINLRSLASSFSSNKPGSKSGRFAFNPPSLLPPPLEYEGSPSYYNGSIFSVNHSSGTSTNVSSKNSSYSPIITDDTINSPAQHQSATPSVSSIPSSSRQKFYHHRTNNMILPHDLDSGESDLEVLEDIDERYQSRVKKTHKQKNSMKTNQKLIPKNHKYKSKFLNIPSSTLNPITASAFSISSSVPSNSIPHIRNSHMSSSSGGDGSYMDMNIEHDDLIQSQPNEESEKGEQISIAPVKRLILPRPRQRVKIITSQSQSPTNFTCNLDKITMETQDTLDGSKQSNKNHNDDIVERNISSRSDTDLLGSSSTTLIHPAPFHNNDGRQVNGNNNNTLGIKWPRLN